MYMAIKYSLNYVHNEHQNKSLSVKTEQFLSNKLKC